MKSEDFALLSRIVYARSGLALKPEKAYLFETRLPPVAQKLRLPDMAALIDLLRRGGQPAAEIAVTEAMTTNETFFFRDTKPFEQFRRLALPALLAARAAKRQLRIWCAAASTGQEPYSLAMILAEERARLAGWRVEIVATDISHEMIARAKEALYTQFEVQRGLPVQYLMRYFQQAGERWQVKSEIRAAVQYRSFNLLDDPAQLGSFDVVFCRNVLIYFDLATKRLVLDRVAAVMPADGHLFLGASETVVGVSGRFEPVPPETGLYRPIVAKRTPVANAAS
jgi:chemotaxis protein methyltransferase CheR